MKFYRYIVGAIHRCEMHPEILTGVCEHIWEESLFLPVLETHTVSVNVLGRNKTHRLHLDTNEMGWLACVMYT